MLATSLQPVVEDDAGHLPSFSSPRPVGQEIARPVGETLLCGRDRVAIVLNRIAAWQILTVGLACIDHGFDLRLGQHPDDACGQSRLVGRHRRNDAGHRDRLNQRRWVRRGPFDRDTCDTVRRIMAAAGLGGTRLGQYRIGQPVDSRRGDHSVTALATANR